MRIHFIFLGKTRRSECRAMLDEYVGRIGRYAPVELTELRETSAASRRLAPQAGETVALLDAAGRSYTTAEFAHWLRKQRDSGCRSLAFLGGGAAGFPEHWRNAASVQISLSSLTLPHELARVVLAEQIYRALTILAGHPYAK
jgi:23S rRNA (pseudouridine1915-N3)-methyltransferase